MLTPHYLEPAPRGQPFTEGHLLNVGVFNLGFCAVNRNAGELLDWWWGHLRSECLHDAIAGLFVDQKWMDIGSVLFGATSLRHYGYNVGVANLHERPIERDADGYYIASERRPPAALPLPRVRPDAARGAVHPAEHRVQGRSRAEWRAAADPCQGVRGSGAREARAARAAAGIHLRARHDRPADQRGACDTPIGSRCSPIPGSVPSPFVAAEAAEYERWRRSARRLAGRLTASDVAKGLRCAMPEEYDELKRRLPRLTRSYEAVMSRTPASGADLR